MKVSIITATYNSAATVADTLASVQRQTYNNIEHIVVDGFSTDETLSVIQKAGHAGPMISEKDQGIYDAMNKGILLTHGEIVGILNSDDFFAHDTVIEEVVDIFEKTGCDAVYGDLIFVHPDKPSKILRKWIAGGYDAALFLKGWMPPHPTFFVKRSVYEQFGNFNISLKSSADYELLLRFLYMHKIKVQYLPDVLVHMRSGGQSTKSVSNRIKAHKEDYMAWRLNNLIPRWYTLILKPVRKIKQFLYPRI
jgi:glycosyltransferase involved in cell wall biosynthesis